MQEEEKGRAGTLRLETTPRVRRRGRLGRATGWNRGGESGKVSGEEGGGLTSSARGEESEEGCGRRALVVSVDGRMTHFLGKQG